MKMKKLGFLLLCLLVFAGTFLIFSPKETSAAPWYCYWFPVQDCYELGGIVLVTQCDTQACYWIGSEDQICLICQF